MPLEESAPQVLALSALRCHEPAAHQQDQWFTDMMSIGDDGYLTLKYFLRLADVGHDSLASFGIL